MYLYILTGKAATGKTTWANNQRNSMIVSDFRWLYHTIEEAARTKKQVIVDINNITRDQINSARSLGKRYKFDIQVLQF